MNNKVALDRCPHRGASLSKGKINDKDEIVCPYHGRCFSERSNPDMFSGVVQDGALWVGGNDVADIPRIPEFDDDGYRSVFMSRRLKGVNAMAFLEAGLDFEHIQSVHSILVADWFTPKVSMEKDRNVNTHTFETPSFRLRVETMFWLPLSNCLKFHFFDKKRKIKREPFILFFSMTPHEDQDVTLHVRSLRRKVHRDLDVLLDFFFIAVSDIPIAEDANVVRSIETKLMLRDELSYQDDFIGHYREGMIEHCPEILDYFTS